MKLLRLHTSSDRHKIFGVMLFLPDVKSINEKVYSCIKDSG